MLTEAERVAVRRFAGYGVSPVVPDTLDLTLLGLTNAQEEVVRSNFLPALSKSEQAIADTSESLDTASAAVWTRNPAELAERSVLFRGQRIMLVRFLGIDPGPGIFDGVMIVPDPCCSGDGATGGGGAGGISAIPAVFVV